MNTYQSIGNVVEGRLRGRLLSHAVPDEVLVRFAHRPTSIERGETKVAYFRRSNAFGAKTTPLEEGVTPEGSKFSYETVNVVLQEYGDYSEFTNHVEDFTRNNTVNDILERQGESVTLTRELLLADVVTAGTNIVYGTGTARNSQTKDHPYSASIAQRVVTSLRNQKTKLISRVMRSSGREETYPIEGAYVAIGPNEMEASYRRLAGEVAKESNHFVSTAHYGTGKTLNQHELGRFESVRYCITSEFALLKGKGAAGTDSGYYNDGTNYHVAQTLMFGREAFGAVPLRGADAAMVKVLNAGEARGGDPLGQRGSVGWRMYYSALILNENWLQRAETAVIR